MPRSFSRGLKPPRYITVTVLAASLSVAGSAQQDIQTAPLSLVPVQGNVHLLVGAGPNIAVQVGGDGIVLVDTPRPALSAQVQEQLRTLSRLPVRYILNTSMDPEHVSGNAAFVPASGRGTGGAPFGALGLARPAIIAHEAVLNRLSLPPAGQPAVPATALPTTTYYLPSMDFHVNGEPVFLYHQANAHTDGDSLILFRNSNVVATGDLYTPDRYPLIDLQRGGSVQGIIAALNRLLGTHRPGGIPGGWHGRDSRSRPLIGRGRCCRIPRHGGDRARPRAGSDQERAIARAGESREAVARLRQRVRQRRRVHRGGLPEPREEIMKVASHRPIGVLILAACAIAPAFAQGRGAPASPPPTARAAAPVDFTGNWVSVVSEDWRWRMITPPKGDYASIPVNEQARKIADTWDPAKDEAAGEQCRAYSAPAIMREPGRLRISWQDDNTLKIETDAGMQTRVFRFGGQPPQAVPRTWQGYSVARWESPLRGVGIGVGGPPLGLGPRFGSAGRTLEVVTTEIRPGYLRKNGVPFSPNAVVNEYFDLFKEPNGTDWFVVTTVVTDPQYLNGPWVTTSNFKKEGDGSKWDPTPCKVR